MPDSIGSPNTTVEVERTSLMAAVAIKTLDQQRATFAWECIADVLTLPPGERHDFGTQVKKLPTRVRAAGLGQALAYLHTRGNAPKLIENLDRWLARSVPMFDAEDRLLVRVIQGDADFQRRATGEVLAYLVWLVRFADGEGLTKNAQE
jgi:CRISPR-associated protein Cmr5